jgi:RNA polymerase sigma factor (sigma-70 family)
MTDLTTTGVPSWEEVVDLHSARVYRLAYRLTGNRADAEDLTQEVFVRVFRSLDTFMPGQIEAWLHRITTNLFLDQARRRARLRFDPVGELADGRYDAAASHAEPGERLVGGVFDGDVEAALAALAPEFRAAVVLCDIEGLSYEEIADVLGVKMGTVRSRIHRGRAQLRRALAHRAPRPGRLRHAGPRDTPLAPQLS